MSMKDKSPDHIKADDDLVRTTTDIHAEAMGNDRLQDFLSFGDTKRDKSKTVRSKKGERPATIDWDESKSKGGIQPTSPDLTLESSVSPRTNKKKKRPVVKITNQES